MLGSASFILSFHVQHHLHDDQHYSCCPCMVFSIIHVVLAWCSLEHYSCCPCMMFSSALLFLSLMMFCVIQFVFAWYWVQHYPVCLCMEWCSVKHLQFDPAGHSVQHHLSPWRAGASEPGGGGGGSHTLQLSQGASARGTHNQGSRRLHSRLQQLLLQVGCLASVLLCTLVSYRLSWPAVNSLCWSASTYKGSN